jgi:hypothetical protein
MRKTLAAAVVTPILLVLAMPATAATPNPITEYGKKPLPITEYGKLRPNPIREYRFNGGAHRAQ